MAEEKIAQLLELAKSMGPKIDPAKTALLIIDMQEYQVRKKYAMYKTYDSYVPGLLDYFVDQTARVAEPNIQRLVEIFRRKKLRIVYTRFASFCRDGSDLIRRFREQNAMAVGICGEPGLPHHGDPSAEIVPSLAPQADDLVVLKNTSGVFNSTALERHLRHMGVETLLVTGVVTNMCVEGAARTAAELGFDVFIVDDACAAWSPEIHAATLRSFRTLFGWVIDTDEAMARIEEGT